MINTKLCLRCKGKLLCGLEYCPLLVKQKSYAPLSRISESFSGASPPGIFISWRNYPKVNVYALASEKRNNLEMFEKPEQWFGLSEQNILEMRFKLLMAGKQFDAKQAMQAPSELEKIQELAMSYRKVDASLELASKPKIKPNVFADVAPLGPKAKLKQLELESNPKVPRKVESVVSDTDAKASDALFELYESDFEVSFLSRLLSAGLLGTAKKRKLVPTRWSITAVDSTLANRMLAEVKQFENIEEFELYSSSYLHNYHYLLLLPASYAFEQLECWLPGSIWSPKNLSILQNYESFRKVASYASVEDGAFYAARFAFIEFLAKRKKQAACIWIREISPKYALPLGVWQVRENIRNAFKKEPKRFESLQQALAFLASELKIPIREYLKRSELLKHFKTQRKLIDFS